MRSDQLQHQRKGVVSGWSIAMLAFLWCLGNVPLVAVAQPQPTDPAIVSWVINTDSTRGSSPDGMIHAQVSQVLADVQRVQFNDTDVYIEATGVPSYPVGPFPDGNPDVPMDQAFIFRMPRTPVENTGPPTPVMLGTIGVFVNGVAIFNALDAFSFDNQGIWNQSAVVAEADGFDANLGHPARRSDYHHHQNPITLRDQLGDDGSTHSPILGFAFDGFPVYGPYGFGSTDGTGDVRRIRSSYRLRTIMARISLPDGTMLDQNEFGPPIGEDFPLGYYHEDYEYVESHGDLDIHNGRFAVTPEYPEGTYAYHLTIDSLDADAPPFDGNVSAYPYSIGPTYFGAVVMDNATQMVTIPNDVTLYDPTTATGIDDFTADIPEQFALHQNYPNPFNPTTTISYDLANDTYVSLHIFNMLGQKVRTLADEQQNRGTYAVVWDGKDDTGQLLTSGVYIVQLTTSAYTMSRKVTLIK